jgi:hypothetical protein
MKKDNAITKRLKESIKEIEVDYKKDASISFLSRKYFVARVTMKTFLQENGIYDKS